MAEEATPALRRRTRRILAFAARVLLQTWWYELALPRLGFGALAERSRPLRGRRAAARFRELALELGGLMIKVGQVLSARLDVLPSEVTAELVSLQDEVPPVPFSEIAALAEAEFGSPLTTVFAAVEEAPIAAASLGQAHRVRLTEADAADTGFQDAVIKVQRPGIEAIVEADLAALARIAGWVSRVRRIAARVDAPALVAEFARTSREEIDYLHEAASAAAFGEQFADDPGVCAPEVVWERTTRRVLTLEDVTAIKITDGAALQAAGIDPAVVAQRLAAAVFEQLFHHGRFHADPHPGNIFVAPSEAAPDGFQLAFVDFGMMGHSSAQTRSQLRRALLAVSARDARGIVEVSASMGLLLPSADTVELERAFGAVFERFGGLGFAQLREVDDREFLRFADEFADTVRELPFQMPESLLLIFRVVSLTSGVCTTLDPAFNVWDAVEPFAASLLAEQSRGAVVDAATDVWASLQIAARLPRRADAALTALERGELQVDTRRVERYLARLEGLAHRLLGGIVFAALVVAGALLRPSDPALSVVFLVASVIPLGFALLPRSRR